MDQPGPLPLAGYDAAVGLPERARQLPACGETEALAVIDATLLQYGPWALYEMARQLAIDVVRLIREFAPYVDASPNPEVRTNLSMFLCMVAEELHGGVVVSAQMFHEVVHWAGEHVGRKMVCSLMCIVRWVRRERRDSSSLSASA